MSEKSFQEQMREANWKMFNEGGKRTKRIITKATMELVGFPKHFYTYDQQENLPLADRKYPITSIMTFDSWMKAQQAITKNNAVLKDKRTPQSALDFLQGFYDNQEAVHNNGFSLVLHGANGTGKTMLACALAYRWMRCFPLPEKPVHDAKFMTMLDIKEWLRAANAKWGDEKDWFDEMTEFLQNVGFLIVDDIVDIFRPDEADLKEIFVRLLKNRAENKKINILITNYDTEKLSNFMGKTLADIMAVKGSYLPINGRLRPTNPPPPWET